MTPYDGFRKFCTCVTELDRKKWLRQIGDDSDDGLLDEISNQVLVEHFRRRITV
jgi:hypothetical protein